MSNTEEMLSIWAMGRTRLTALLPGLTDEALTRRLHPDSNSVGWLLRHIGEVEQLFARNVFGLDVKVKAYTLGGVDRRASHGSAEELVVHLEESAARLREAIGRQEAGSWGDPVSTPEFGTIAKREALGRIISHTAYHAGQLRLALKYGTPTSGPEDGPEAHP